MRRLFSVLLVAGLALGLLGIRGNGFAKENFRIALLYQFGEVIQRGTSTTKIGKHFGVSTEIKLADGEAGEIWLGGSCLQTPVFIIIKENEEMFFEELSSRNFQVYIKGEFGPDFFQLFLGLGLDLWQLNSREEKVVERKMESDYYWRPFLLIGVQVPVPLTKNLALGIQSISFLGEGNFNQATRFKDSSTRLYLSLGF